MPFLDYGLSFASQVGTSLVNNALSQHNAREQRDWQERMMDKQNEYNHPLADKLRKMSAGVNPYAGELNSVPSAFAGTGAQAQTIPMGDPLSTAFTMAQIRNLDAETGKTVTETDKILAEISNLEILNQKGIISNDEMQFRLNKLKEAWKEKSQYQADLEQTEAETKSAEAQASLSAKEEQLTDLRISYQNAVNEHLPIEQQRELAESVAREAASYATASAQHANAKRTSDQNSREALQHDMDMAIKALENQGILTENQAKELQFTIEKAWNEGVFSKDAEGHRWQNFKTMVNDFVHSNLNLSGTTKF